MTIEYYVTCDTDFNTYFTGFDTLKEAETYVLNFLKQIKNADRHVDIFEVSIEIHEYDEDDNCEPSGTYEFLMCGDDDLSEKIKELE